MKRTRVGLVGCGRLAEAGYLPAIGRVSEMQLVAVADVDAGRRRAVGALAADLLGVPVPTFADAASLLDETEVDALLLATPAIAHLADAQVAARRGIPALVEKPPAPDAEGAAALAALDPAPCVAFNRRFDPGAAIARDAIPPSGLLDVHVEIRYRRQSWAAFGVHDDALGDLGPHLVDWVRWLTRCEVVEVARAEVTATRAEVEVILDRGRATLSAATDRPHLELIEVRDGAGLVARHRVGGLAAGLAGRLRPGPHPLVETITAELQAFVRALGGHADTRLGTAADGLAVMAVIDAARVAARTDSPTPVRHPAPR